MEKEKESINFLESIPILNLAEPTLTSIHFKKKKIAGMWWKVLSDIDSYIMFKSMQY